MKPVVSAFNAWTWYEYETGGEGNHIDRLGNSIVISVFAIVILSVIGSMFASGNHAMMGSTEDPKDGKGVAAAVFGAVIVYGVCSGSFVQLWGERSTCADTTSGLPSLLRQSGFPTPETAGGRRDCAAVDYMADALHQKSGDGVAQTGFICGDAWRIGVNDT